MASLYYQKIGTLCIKLNQNFYDLCILTHFAETDIKFADIFTAIPSDFRQKPL